LCKGRLRDVAANRQCRVHAFFDQLNLLRAVITLAACYSIRMSGWLSRYRFPKYVLAPSPKH
jgi:hypothetical protein